MRRTLLWPRSHRPQARAPVAARCSTPVWQRLIASIASSKRSADLSSIEPQTVSSFFYAPCSGRGASQESFRWSHRPRPRKDCFDASS
jgi:hypothetical protein